MDIKCHYCGGVAKQVSHHIVTPNEAELAFQCQASACKKLFAGVLTIGRAGLPGDKNFSIDRLVSGAGRIVTDC